MALRMTGVGRKIASKRARKAPGIRKRLHQVMPRKQRVFRRLQVVNLVKTKVEQNGRNDGAG
jgi:hypothetical protein